MITKKQFTLLFCVFLFAVMVYHSQPVDALPFDNEYVDVYIAAGNYHAYYDNLTAGDELTGYFETDDTSMGLDFFICDAANYSEWVSFGTGTGFEINTNMHSLGFDLTVPYSDEWYLVLSNAYASYVYVDIAFDVNGDNSPFYSTSDYDYTGYGELLEVGNYHEFSVYLYEGTVVDGHFSTFFTSDGVDFFIMDDSNFNDWVYGYSATKYSQEYSMHQANIDTFTVPTSDTWHFVWENDDTDAMTISYGVGLDTSNANGGGSGVVWIGTIGIVAGLFLLIICCCVCRSKKKEQPYVPPVQPTGDYRTPQPTQPAPVREREIVRDRVLVICPYCGAKNEQGVLNCYNCDAEL